MRTFKKRERQQKIFPFLWCCHIITLLIVFGFFAIGMPFLIKYETKQEEGRTQFLTLMQSQEVLLREDAMLNAGDVIYIKTTITNAGVDMITDLILNHVDTPVETVCMISGMNETIGDLNPGESVCCTGLYIIKQDDIDRGVFIYNASFLDGNYTVSSTSNLTQTTFGEITVTNMFNLINGSVTLGDLIHIDVKVVNTGTETVLNITGLTDVLLPTAMINYSYVYSIVQEDIDNGYIDFFDAVEGIGTTSARPITANSTVRLVFSDYTTTELGIVVTSAFEMLNELSMVGDAVMVIVTVTNNGTRTVQSVSIVEQNIGPNLVCTPMNTVGTIGIMFPGETQTCTGAFLLTLSDFTGTTGSNVTITTSATGTALDNEANTFQTSGQGTGTLLGISTVWGNYLQTPIVRNGIVTTDTGFSTFTTEVTSVANFVAGTPGFQYSIGSQADAPLRFLNFYQFWSGQQNNVITVEFANFLVHPRHEFGILHIAEMGNPSTFVVTTVPAGLQTSWTVIKQDALDIIWNPSAGTLFAPSTARLGAIYLNMGNLNNYVSISVEFRNFWADYLRWGVGEKITLA